MDELRKQQIIDKKAYDQKLVDDLVRKHAWKHHQENTIVDGDMMADLRTSEVLGPEVDYTSQFQPISSIVGNSTSSIVGNSSSAVDAQQAFNNMF